MTFLLAAVFIPLLLSPLVYAFGRKLGTNFATWFSFSALAISTILLMIPAMGLGRIVLKYTRKVTNGVNSVILDSDWTDLVFLCTNNLHTVYCPRTVFKTAHDT